MADITRPLMLDSTGQEIANAINDLSETMVTPQIVDNLTTADATKVLSANQGKILKDSIDAINNVTVTTPTSNMSYFYSFDYARVVRQGNICDVAIDFQARSSITSYVTLTSENLPKPVRSFYFEVASTYGYATPIVNVDSNGAVKAYNVSAGRQYFMHFTYICTD